VSPQVTWDEPAPQVQWDEPASKQQTAQTSPQVTWDAPSPAVPPAPVVSPGIGSISAAPDRTILDRIKDSLVNTAVGHAIEQGLPKVADALNIHPSETIYSPEYQQHKEQLVSPEEMVDPNTQNIPARVSRGVLGLGGALTTPDNLAIIGTTQGLGLLGEAAPTVSRLIAAGFSYQMLKGAVDQYPQLKDSINKGDYGTAAETLTKMAGSTAMAALGVRHAAGDLVADAYDPNGGTGKIPVTGKVTANPEDAASTTSTANLGEAPAPANQIKWDADEPASTKDDAVTPGPGAQNLGTGVNETGVTLGQIGKSMRGGATPSVMDRINDAIGPEAIKEKISDAVSGAVDSTTDAATQGLDRVKAVGSALWDAYKEPEQWTDFKDARGKWDYALQKSSNEAMQFAKDIKAGVPDELVREGMVNYIQSGGDDALLAQRSAASSGDLAKGYEAARNLTSTQRIQAENISSWFNQKLQDAKDSGMLSAGIENYVNQIWDRPNPVTQKLQADIDYGTLNTKPSLLKKRVFDSYFDGEQAGFKPKNKDIGYLVTAYDEAFNKATAGRAFIKSMLDGKGKDGRPLLVANGDRASSIKGPDGNVSANMISPKFIGEEFGDYKPIDHPALRKWTWIGKDSDGKPIFQNGDLWAHPEVYGELKNNLSNSALRQIPAVRTVMDVGQKIKGSMLGYSLFHQVQEGVHAVGHGVNPFNVGKIIDFDAPDQKTLIEHGLQVSNARAQSEFMDGHNEAYAYRVPVIGRKAQQYGDYLFNDYIPNLKMKTGLDILDRNRERYANKYSQDQIAELSAKQANAAYGELNYRQMGRNKTMQDVFRLLSLAPDFTEARGRFVAQALRPEGAEQRMALLRLTAVMYGAARVGNMALNNGNPRIDKPFAVTFHGKDYSLRSVVGDAEHLVSDPRSFIYYRLNPTITKPLIQYLTGTDEFGRKRATTQLIGDTLKGWSPIAVQKWIKNPQSFSPLDSLLTSLGVQSFKATPSDKVLRKQFTTGALPAQQLQKMQDRGDISADQAQKISAPARKTASPEGDLVKGFNKLPPEQALALWSDLSADQQQRVAPSLRKLDKRIDGLDRTSIQRQLLHAKITAALAGHN